MKITFILPIALSVLGSAFQGCHREEASVPPAVEVTALSIAKKTVPGEIVASGAIEAVDKAELAFQVPGRVLTVEVADGSVVKQGEVLARLDPADLQQALAISEANLAEVRARHARLSRLHELGSLTDTDFDKIDAALKQSESAAELSRRQLSYAELRAPFDGIAVKRGLAAGVVVTPGLPVFTVLSPAPVWANVGVAEVDARRVNIGQKAAVLLPAAVGDAAHAGVVEAVLPQADPLSRSFTVKIRLDNADRTLRPGNVVTTRILTGETREIVSVPPQAVAKNPDGSLFVWLVDPVKHTAVRQIVEAGALGSTEVEIRSGLKSGDQVVLAIPHTLFEGMPLKVTLSR